MMIRKLFVVIKYVKQILPWVEFIMIRKLFLGIKYVKQILPWVTVISFDLENKDRKIAVEEMLL